MHLPAEDKNYVPNKKFNKSDFPADYGPKTPITSVFSYYSYSKI